MAGPALVMMAGIAWLMFAGPTLLGACKAVMATSFQFTLADVEDFEPFRPLLEAGWKVIPSLASLFAVTIVATIASQAGLGSVQFNPKAVAPKPSKLNPASGLKRIFGMQGWTELGKSLLKVVLLGAMPITYAVWKDLFAQGWMRVATLLFAASLGWHAWVGMRDILMDYVKPAGVRLALQVAVLLVIAGYLGWTIQILWR